MWKLAAEEELLARDVMDHPYLEKRDKQAKRRELLAAIGHAQPVKKATHADLASIGITVKGNDG